MNDLLPHALRQSAVDPLIDMWDNPDPWAYNLDDIAPLQLAAIQERFVERRGQLKVLDQRARDQQINEVSTLQDVVPLLFSHTTYKSYPESFVTKGQWKLLTRWLGTLSTMPVDNIDLTGVENVDDWIKAAQDAGHLVMSSSGTSGHSSYVNQVPDDRAHHRRTIELSTAIETNFDIAKHYALFAGLPKAGRNMGSEHVRLLEDIFARPDEVHYLSDEYVSVAELDRLAMIRRSIIAGTATAGAIADAEQEAAQRQEQTEGQIQRWLDGLLERRKEPLVIFAGASMLWRIVEHGRANGIGNGEFNPNSLIKTGGGMKGFRGPENYLEQVREFFGLADNHYPIAYGMTELLSPAVGCKHGAYHISPTTILLLLDKSGEQVINQPSGVVEGRGGFFDLMLQGRWGGVISGDRLTINFDPCKCGRSSPSILEITRYKDLPEGDDKLSCAGQVDTYVRGFVGGDWQE